MKNKVGKVYGIGNPLIDVYASVSDEELSELGLYKGTMNLISKEKRLELSEFIKSKKPVFNCGGSCPNTIISLASLGISTTLGGKVGNDEWGNIYNEKLNTLNVDNNLVISDSVTGSSIILVTPDSERTMNTYLGANREYNSDDVIEESVSQADFFHFTGYMWDTDNQKQAIQKAMKIAKQNGVLISFDIADPFAVGRYRDSFEELIRENCDIVFANKEEARSLVDKYDAYECCRTIGKMCETAVVKNGKRGSFVSYRQEIFEIPVKGLVTPVDTTGAGDNYAAGFLYGLCHGYDVRECGLIASILAGEIISQVGAQFSKEKAAELKQLFESDKWKLV